MCGFVEAMTAISAVGSMLGSAASARQQADHSAANARYSAAVARNNATIARQQADFEEGSGREQARRALSARQARFAASGVATGTGSPLDVLGDTAADAEIDALAVRYGGRVQANRFETQRRGDLMAAGQARERGRLRVGTALLTGSADLAGSVARSADAKRRRSQ